MQYKEHIYAESELLYNALMEPALKAAINLLHLPVQNARVLDVGCGPGGVFPILRGAIGPTGEILAVDASTTHLAKAREQIALYKLEKSVKLEKVNLLEDLPFPKNHFDAIWIADVIFPSLFKSPSELVRRLKDALKPEGTFAIFYGNWLRPLFLPGYARLEHLICAAKELKNAKERSWEGHIHPECALSWLREAGFTSLRLDLLPVHYRYPLPEKVYEYVGTYGLRTYYAEAVEAYGQTVGMSQEDRALWEHISNPHQPEYLLDQPDYYCAAFALLAVGQKPS
jgi:SAM-dependent methyltransferase